MNPKNAFVLAFRVVVASVVVTMASVFEAYAQSGDIDKTTEIIKRWDSISTSVVTAKLKCRHLMLIANRADLPNSRSGEEMNRFFHDQLVPLVDSVNAAAKMEEATKRLLEPGAGALDGDWERLDIVTDGRTLRNDEYFERVGKEPDKRTRVRFEDEEIAHASDINQATVDAGQSQIRMVSVSDVRFVPNLGRYLGDPKLRLIQTDGSSSKLTCDKYEIEFDRNTGFVHHATWTKPNGRTKIDIWQVLPKPYSGGVEIPSISAAFHYRDTSDGESRVTLADVFVVDTVELNQEISPDEFIISVPKGTVVANRTAKHSKNCEIVPFTATSDVRDIKDIKAPTDQMRPPVTPRAISLAGRWLLALNLAAIMLIAVYWVYRTSRSK